MGELEMAQTLWELLMLLLYLVGVLFSTLLATLLLSGIILIIAAVGMAIHDQISKRKEKERQGKDAKTNR